MNAIKAGSEAIFKYAPNVSSLTIVIAIIPGAEPIRRREPPTPTISAKRTQRLGSIVFTMSIAAAVRGMLSKTADNPPIAIFPQMILVTDGTAVNTQ